MLSTISADSRATFAPSGGAVTATPGMTGEPPDLRGRLWHTGTWTFDALGHGP